MDSTPDTKLEDFNPNEDLLKTRRGYSVIHQIFIDLGVPETHFPSFEEWVELIDKEELHVDPNLGFVPGKVPSAMGGFAAKVGMDALRSSGLRFSTADDMLKDLRSKAEAGIKSRARQAAANVFESFVDKGDGGTSKANYQGGSRFNETGLSQTLKPIDSNFGTDIPFPGQTKYWQDGGDHSGPLLIKSGCPGLISNADDGNRDSQMWDFITGPVTMEWNSKIAEYITWTGRVVTLLTNIKISDYINRCLYVCLVYYFWRSVIAFTDDPRNRNAGMDALRNQLTPTDYNNLFTLRREMMQSAIPPFVHEFCFYIMGTYRQSHLPTSPIMKIMPHGFASTSNPYFTGEAATYSFKSSVTIARDHLSQLKEYNNVLSRAIGGWGGIEPFEYTSAPRVDPDYTTFWTNARYACTNATGVNFFPIIATPETEVVVNSHTDAPDGWVSAMIAPNVVSTGTTGVGLFHEWRLADDGLQIASASSTYSTDKHTSCYIYIDDGQPGFYPIEAAQTYQALSGNTFNTVASSSTYHGFQKFGTERIIMLNSNSLRQTNFQFIDLLYCQDFRNIPSSRAWNNITSGRESNSKPNWKSRKKGKGMKTSKTRPYGGQSSKDKDEL